MRRVEKSQRGNLNSKVTLSRVWRLNPMTSSIHKKNMNYDTNRRENIHHAMVKGYRAVEGALKYINIFDQPANLLLQSETQRR